MQIEADDRGHDIRRQLQFGIHRMYVEEITVRVVALGRAGTSVAGCTEIRPGLQGTGRHAVTARPKGQFANIGRNVDDQPVPEAAARRRVWIETGDREAFRPRGRLAPGEMW